MQPFNNAFVKALKREILIQAVGLLILFGVVLALSFLVRHNAHGAPVPKAKPVPPRPAIGGYYDMVFHNVVYKTILLEGGDYVCHAHNGNFNNRWEGRWELKGDVFTITERFVTPESVGDYVTFKFQLEKLKLESVCGNLKLRKPQ